MAIYSTTTFSNTTRKNTTNYAYNRVMVDDNGNFNVWWLSTDDYTDQTSTVTLDGVDYDIRLRWNTRDESWQVIMGLSGENASATFKATNGIDLLRPYKYLEGVPDGELYIIDEVAINGRPAFGETGSDKRFRFSYIDSVENQA